MAEKKYLDENGLSHLKSKLDLTYEKKGEGGAKSYNDLTDIPTLDETPIKGALTKEGLGIAAKTDIPTDNKTLTNGAGYQTASDVNGIVDGKGFQTAEDVEGILTGKKYQTAADVEGILSGKDYQTSEDVESAITEKGYQTSSEVEEAITSKGYQTQAEVEATVNAKVASAYKYKGTVADYASLSEKEDTAVEGDVWNTEDSGQNYAWTGNAWDSLGATFDASEFVKESELTSLTNEDIDSIFA